MSVDEYAETASGGSRQDHWQPLQRNSNGHVLSKSSQEVSTDSFSVQSVIHLRSQATICYTGYLDRTNAQHIGNTISTADESV